MIFLRFKNKSNESEKYAIENITIGRWDILGFVFNSQEDYITVKKILTEQDEIVSEGIEIIENDIIIASYDSHKFIYEAVDERCYLGLTNGEIVFYDFLIPGEDGNIISITMKINQDSADGLYLYRSGISKEYAEWRFKLFDEYGYPLYKLVDGELVDTTQESREAHRLSVLSESLKFAMSAKLAEINNLCNKFVIEGVDFRGRKYSYTLEDQSNILAALQVALATNMSVPYHANNQSCSLHTPEEMVNLYILQSANLTHHITYTNQLKLYVENELTTQDEVESVTYGQELTGQYLETYNKMIDQAQQNADTYVAKLSTSGMNI